MIPIADRVDVVAAAVTDVDATLLRAVAAGDEAALRALYERG